VVGAISCLVWVKNGVILEEIKEQTVYKAFRYLGEGGKLTDWT
jgi:hypothetical protein